MSFPKNEESISLTMDKVVQYQPISTESDEEIEIYEDNEPIIRSQQSKARRKHNTISWNCECVSRLLGLYILFLVAVGFAIHHMPPINAVTSSAIVNEKIEVHHHHVFTKAAVAAGAEECSEVGVEILRKGGSGVDSAIAASLCQGVVQPQFSGIGGGFFMTIFNKTTNRSTVIDAREVAPQGSTRDMFVNVETPVTSALSIAIPGALKGYRYAYDHYGGKVNWKDLFAAAIDKAENGYAVGGQLAINLVEFKKEILNSEELCAVFCNDAKSDLKKKGDIVKNLKLANTLKSVSQNGIDAFYEKSTVQAIANEIKRKGGIVTTKDFSDYQVLERNTIKIQVSSSLEIHVPPLPSGGPVLALIMSIMDAYKITNDLFSLDKTLYWHLTVESFKHAFGSKTHFGDPNFNEGANKFVRELLTPQSILALHKKIKDDKTFSEASYYGTQTPLPPGLDSSTSHVSVLAPNGDAVAVTSTINTHFGSLHMSSSTGVLFNNEMMDFFTEVDPNSNKTGPNEVEPHKRPQSSMSPCFVVDTKSNEVVYIIGAAGGRHIPTSVAIALLRLLYFNVFDFDDAIKEPRLHNDLSPDILYYEKEFDKEIIDNLQKMGHQVKVQRPMSHVNGIKNHISHVHAYSDLRSIGAEADGW